MTPAWPDATRPGHLRPGCHAPWPPAPRRPGPALAPWMPRTLATCVPQLHLGYGPLKQVVAQVGLGALLSRRFPGIDSELEFE